MCATLEAHNKGRVNATSTRSIEELLAKTKEKIGVPHTTIGEYPHLEPASDMVEVLLGKGIVRVGTQLDESSRTHLVALLQKN